MTSSPESPDSSSTESGDSGIGSSLGPPLLKVRGLSKHFGAVRAMENVDLDVPAGQVTALIGDNGAGKSTLIKTVAGIWAPTAGQIFWKGQEVHIHTPRTATDLGIATVYQDLALCDNLDIVQNMYLGREEMRRGTLDEIKMELETRKLLNDLSVSTVKSVRQLVGSLSGGQRQAVAVARAVMRQSELVILDEPTAALGVTQTGQVLELIKTLSSRGIGVIVISHNLNDVFAVADRIAILHLGRMAAVGPAKGFDSQVVVDFMTTGRSTRVSGNGHAAEAQS